MTSVRTIHLTSVRIINLTSVGTINLTSVRTINLTSVRSINLTSMGTINLTSVRTTIRSTLVAPVLIRGLEIVFWYAEMAGVTCYCFMHLCGGSKWFANIPRIKWFGLTFKKLTVYFKMRFRCDLHLEKYKMSIVLRPCLLIFGHGHIGVRAAKAVQT